MLSIREAIVSRALTYRGAPYFFGADGPDAFDCNGFLLDAFRRNGAADVYPWPERRPAHDFWALLPRVAWEERQPADIVCFGDAAGCHHVVLVLNGDWLIGANHGGPPHAEESDGDYQARMAAADGGLGARVCVVPSEYWASARLGVVRIPACAEPSPR